MRHQEVIVELGVWKKVSSPEEVHRWNIPVRYKGPPNGNEHCVFKRGKEVGLEKRKQGRSREERKSERSQTQTVGYSGEFVCV